MALVKSVELDNGVVVTYHRIVSINKITNKSIIIEVASYINESKRQEEIEKQELGEPMNIYIDTTYLNKDYNETETIEDLYDYLKTTDKFKNAQDA
jgi:hypothetical protein